MGLSFFEKVWKDHAIRDLGGNTHLLQIDRLFLVELGGSLALRRVASAGHPLACKDQIYAVTDHNVSIQPGRGPNDPSPRGGAEMIVALREAARENGFPIFDVTSPHQGIVHVISPELGIALPGTTLVCGDSHTCTIGGVGAIGWGIGTSEVEHVLATQTLPQVKPKTMRIQFQGRLAPGTFPKDMILYLIGSISAAGGIGFAAEFAGEAIRTMPIEGRLTLCNMAIEFQAKYGFVPPDDVTFNYLSGREYAPKGQAWDYAEAYWRGLATDSDTIFDKEIEIDCNRIVPQVTWGTNPQQVIAIDGRIPDPSKMTDSATRALADRAISYMRLKPETPISDVAIDVAYIGSCTNSRLSDLRAAAAILRGRKIAEGVEGICVPGSTPVKRMAEAEGLDAVFRDAGFQWMESGCGLCGGGAGEHLSDRRVISTTNRNFENRQGIGTRTHLASPATVAASAVMGRITDPRRLMDGGSN
jgi:3-isopropylmalate/(R)-2-methylmalate dehydratase large subunit